MVILNLTAGNKKIELQMNFYTNMNWCTLFFRAGSQYTKLGSDSFSVVKEKFRHALEHRNEIETRPINDAEAFLIINLMDPHGSMYAAKTEHGLDLLFFDAQGNLVPLLTLDDEKIGNWLLVLNSVEWKDSTNC